VHAAALNRLELWVKMGAYGELPFPIVAGSDGAGVIVATGETVNPRLRGAEVVINPVLGWGESDLSPGPELRILGLHRPGTFASFVNVPADCAMPKPAHLSFREAAALPLTGVTAYRALFVRAALRRGEKVLIHGVGGGVGAIALKLAAAAGASVAVTSGSDEKLALAKSLGAAQAVNYRHDDWVTRLQREVGGFDVVLDSAGGSGLSKLVELAAPRARIINVGVTRGLMGELDLLAFFGKELSLLGSLMGSPRDFSNLLKKVSDWQIRPVIGEVVALDAVNEALHALERGEQFGKLILDMQAD
jgi:NADPH:quinone reductase-like Zn-dependent oxidoreductase